jgi:uncharacterized protein YfdQ (DUF2303 family)
MSDDDDNMQAIIDAARLGAEPKKLDTVGSIQHWGLPTVEGVQAVTISLEKGLAAPLRPRGTMKVFDAASFNDLLTANDHAGDTTIYINRDATAPAIVAVLNGNGPNGPGWGDFRAELVFRFTPQWKRWTEIDGRMLNQGAFAEFVETNMGDIVTPVGAEMLEIAQYLSATRSVDFKSAIRLSSGQIQFQNLESIDAKVGAGQVAIPETITLGLAPVFGLPPFRVEARFRYRIQDGKLQLGIKLQRVEDIMEAVVNDMVNGTVGSEGRPAVKGIDAPQGSVMVEGIAPGPVP